MPKFAVSVNDVVVHQDDSFINASAVYSRKIMMARQEVGRLANASVVLTQDDTVLAQFNVEKAA